MPYARLQHGGMAALAAAPAGRTLPRLIEICSEPLPKIALGKSLRRAVRSAAIAALRRPEAAR